MHMVRTGKCLIGGGPGHIPLIDETGVTDREHKLGTYIALP